MKKLLCFILACACTLTFTACEHNPAQQTKPGGGTTPGGTTPGGTTPGEDGKTEFGVTVVDEEGQPFSAEGLTVVWSNREEAVTQTVGADGTAKKLLDGDYKVTLQGIPDGYTYNPNIYYSTNRQPTETIKVYKLNLSRDSGEDIYETIIDLTRTGAYRAIIEDKDDVVFYEFQATLNGYYTIESCVDTTFNEVNPIMDVYYGNTAAKYFEYTLNDGSDYCDTYTKNFKHTIRRAQDEVKSSFAFGVRATHKTNSFPTYVDFIVERGDEYERPSSEGIPKSAEEDFSKGVKWDTGDWTWAENGTNMFRNEDFVLCSDGYYHLKDEVTGEPTEKKLYAMITKVIDNRPFEPSEMFGTVTLEGIANGVIPQDMLRNIGGYRYNDFVKEYARHCNADGVYPVTEELRVLLQGFAATHRYFADGEGTFETVTKVYADEDEQWLFACGFYK